MENVINNVNVLNIGSCMIEEDAIFIGQAKK